MIQVEYRSQNNPEYHKLFDVLEAKYPPNRFVAISEGKEVGNNDDFEELVRQMDASGYARSKTHIVQVGNEAPDYMEFCHPYA